MRGPSGKEGTLPHPAAGRKISRPQGIPARRNGPGRQAGTEGPAAHAGSPLPRGTPLRTGPAKLDLFSSSLWGFFCSAGLFGFGLEGFVGGFLLFVWMGLGFF